MNNSYDSLIESDAGSATLNMILETLSDFEIIHIPDDCSRKIALCDIPDALIVPEANPHNVSSANKLILTNKDNVRWTIEDNPESMCLLLLHVNQELSADITELIDDFTDSIVVIRETKSANVREEALATRIQERILAINYWTLTLMATARVGSFQDLIDIASEHINGFIAIFDALNNIEGQTSEESASFTHFTKDFSDKVLSLINELISGEKSFSWNDPDNLDGVNIGSAGGLYFIPYELTEDNNFLGQVWLILKSKDEATPALREYFSIFCKQCSAIAVKKFKMDRSSNTSPKGALLSFLIDGKGHSTVIVAHQAESVGLKYDASYRLVLFGGIYSESPNVRSMFVSNLQTAFPESTAFLHNDEALLFVYDEAKMIQASGDFVTRCNIFCHSHNCDAFISDAADSIEDLKFTYTQTKVTKNAKQCIDVRRTTGMDESRKRSRVYQFYEAAPYSYYIYDNEGAFNPDYLSFCYRTLPIRRIIEHDDEYGTNDLAVIYYYLFYDRKTKPISERLGMHRNNVLYRIKTIEQRYHIDLNDAPLRDRLKNDCNILMAQSESFRKYFTD
ncbi:MAG: helix-turn-helix domain-containing protein [Coriobacteriales bacterium]|jgi:hypothetical protein